MISKKRHHNQPPLPDLREGALSRQNFDIEKIKASKGQRQESRKQMYKYIMVNGHEQNFAVKSKKEAIKKAGIVASTCLALRSKSFKGYHVEPENHAYAGALYRYSDRRMSEGENPWLYVEDIYVLLPVGCEVKK